MRFYVRPERCVCGSLADFKGRDPFAFEASNDRFMMVVSYRCSHCEREFSISEDIGSIRLRCLEATNKGPLSLKKTDGPVN